MAPAGSFDASGCKSASFAPRPCSNTISGAPSRAPSGTCRIYSRSLIAPPSVQRCEDLFELGALRLEPRREHELPAERVRGLVHREARPVRGDLQQQPVRRAEVDAPEV